jgi:hypothetical protein
MSWRPWWDPSPGEGRRLGDGVALSEEQGTRLYHNIHNGLTTSIGSEEV